MNKNNLISIIIPIYNAEKHVEKCLESIMTQTYTNLEIILINDGSTDKSINICKKIASLDPRIRLFSTKNKGVASARNTGLDNATGDYIGFVDSDDYISASMYEDLLSEILKNDADIAECGYYTETSNGLVIREKKFNQSIIEDSYKCSQNYIKQVNTANYNWNKLYRKEILEGIRYSGLAYSEDYVFNVKAFYNCSKKVTISGSYYHYLVNEDGAVNKPFTNKKFDMIKAGKETIEFHKKRYSNLIPDIALYTMNKIIFLHRELSLSKVKSKNKYNKVLIDEAFDIYKLLSYSDKKLKFLIYIKCPRLYFAIEKIYSYFKKNTQ